MDRKVFLEPSAVKVGGVGICGDFLFQINVVSRKVSAKKSNTLKSKEDLSKSGNYKSGLVQQAHEVYPPAFQAVLSGNTRMLALQLDIVRRRQLF